MMLLRAMRNDFIVSLKAMGGTMHNSSIKISNYRICINIFIETLK